MYAIDSDSSDSCNVVHFVFLFWMLLIQRFIGTSSFITSFYYLFICFFLLFLHA